MARVQTMGTLARRIDVEVPPQATEKAILDATAKMRANVHSLLAEHELTSALLQDLRGEG